MPSNRRPKTKRGRGRAVVPSRLLVLVALAGVAPWPPWSASAQIRAGAHAVYRNELLDGVFGFGGRVETGLNFVAQGLSAVATYDRYRAGCEGCSLWEAGGQVAIGNETLRVGVGSTFQRYDRGDGQDPSDDWSLQLVAGLRFPLAPWIAPFAEFRQELLGDAGNAQTIGAGILLAWPRARRAPARPAS